MLDKLKTVIVLGTMSVAWFSSQAKAEEVYCAAPLDEWNFQLTIDDDKGTARLMVDGGLYADYVVTEHTGTIVPTTVYHKVRGDRDIYLYYIGREDTTGERPVFDDMLFGPCPTDQKAEK